MGLILPTIILYLILEGLFFCYQIFLYHIKTQPLTKPIPPNESPRELFFKVLVQASKLKSYGVRRFMEGWFLGAKLQDIKRGNLKEFVCWGFVARSVEDLTEEEDEEIEGIVDSVIVEYKVNFEDGYNEEVSCCKMTLEDIEFIPRPLLLYVLIAMKQLATYLILQMWGFRLRRVGGGMSYYHKVSSQGCEGDPLVLFHGLSTGWGGYLPMVNVFRGREVFLINCPQISMSLDFKPLIPDVFTATVHSILSSHRVSSCIVVGHSFGTIQAAWLNKRHPSLISSLVLLDPVCIGLSLPDVACNFLYRKPSTFVEWLIYLMASRELGISFILRRHFWWFHNVIWLEEEVLPNTKVIVGCGSGDEVACPIAVEEIVRRYNDSILDTQPTSEDSPPPRQPIDFVSWKGFSHAQLLFNPGSIEEIHDMIEKSNI